MTADLEQRPASVPPSGVKPASESLWPRLGIPLLLIATLWVARYWRLNGFGLYEDDLTWIPAAVQMTFTEILRFVSDYIVHLYGHAGPLDESLIHIFSGLGWQLGGLRGIYAIGFAIEAANVLIFYALLRRLYPRAGFPLLGALAYTLFSADTTQSFLTHSLSLQPSLTLLLLALHAWLSGRRVLAYALSLVILFAYETPYPVFLAAPLLDHPWDRRLPRLLVRHAAVVGLLLAAAAGVKAMAGEERVTDLGFANAIVTPLNHMVVGPLASLATFGLRPLETLRSLRLDVLLVILAAFGVLTWALWRQDIPPSRDVAESIAWLRDRIRRILRRGAASDRPAPGEPPRLFRLAVAGVCMWILAYPLTFTTLGYHIRGRPTRVHLAAVVGSSLTVAAVGTAVVQAAGTKNGRRWRLAGLAAWMGLMAGYGLVLQSDYVRAWQLEKDFWLRLLPLIQDAGEGTAILVDPEGIEDTYQIAANTWNLPRVLDQLLVLPPEWEDPPRVYRLAPGWADSILDAEGRFVLDGTTSVAPPSLYGTCPASHVILIETRDEPWVRRLGPVVLGSQTVDLELGQGSGLGDAPRGLLGSLLFGDDEDQPTSFIEQAGGPLGDRVEGRPRGFGEEGGAPWAG